MANEENLTSYVPGQSGNLKGKPKGTRNRSTIVREILELVTKSKNTLTGEEQDMTQAERMTYAMVNKAVDGDVNAFKELMDSGYGKNADKVDINDKRKTVSDLFPDKDELDEAERLLSSEDYMNGETED